MYFDAILSILVDVWLQFFQAGTKMQVKNEESQIVTNGGRVLGVTALGQDIKKAIDMAYQACERINFEGIYYRKDIGRRALNRPISV